MIKILKSKEGMTLTELIVGMVLFAIVAAAASAMLVPMLRIYTKANNLAECNTLLDNVANQIIGDLLESTKEPEWDNDHPSITVTIDDPGDVLYTIGDGVLLKNGEPVLKKNFYKGKSVSFICAREGTTDKSYRLTVIITSDRDGEMIRRDYAVRPLVLNPYGLWNQGGTDPTEPGTTDPTITYTVTCYLAAPYADSYNYVSGPQGSYKYAINYPADPALLEGFPKTYTYTAGKSLIGSMAVSPTVIPGYSPDKATYAIPGNGGEIVIYYTPDDVKIAVQLMYEGTFIEAPTTITAKYNTVVKLTAEETISFTQGDKTYNYKIRSTTHPDGSGNARFARILVNQAGPITSTYQYYNFDFEVNSPFPPWSMNPLVTVDGSSENVAAQYYDLAYEFAGFFLDEWYVIKTDKGDVGYRVFEYEGVEYVLAGSLGVPGNSSINSVNDVIANASGVSTNYHIYLTDSKGGFKNWTDARVLLAYLFGESGLKNDDGSYVTSAEVTSLAMTFAQKETNGLYYLKSVTLVIKHNNITKTITITYQ